jgi:hypothetical protein
MARPTRTASDSRKLTLFVLGAGGAIVLGLFALGTAVWLRAPVVAASASAPLAAVPSAPLVSAPQRLDPNRLLAEARREATAWHPDAVLVSLSAGPLDARGVITEGKVEIAYAKPSGQRVSGGADAGGERLILDSTGGKLASREERLAKARIAPEPNCLFEDAWAAAQRAGADAQAALVLRYGWSDKYSRPVWDVATGEGQVLRRVDGVSCSILTR